MFRKRLKGLLAMVLAGSIAATALPLTASANIYGGITVYNGVTSKELDYANFQSDTLVSGNLNSNSLWSVYYNYSSYSSGVIIDSGTRVESVSGDMLVREIDRLDGPPYTDYTDIKISAQHKYIVTTQDPSTTSISIESVKPTSTFPLEISLSEYGLTASPLIDHYSCTAWYGVPGLNSTIVSHSSLVESNVKSVTSSADSEIITVGMEAFAGLYSADIDTVAEDKAKDIFENGITILQLNPEYKTFDIPVRNAVLVQEKESDGSNKTLTVRKDNEDWLDTEDDSFYLCYAYADEETRFFQISSSEMTTEKAVWDEIAAWVTENEDLDTSNLFLCRNVMANVCGNGTNSQFDTKDLIDYQIVNQGQSTTNKALIALYTANAKSIWRVVPFDNSNLSFYTYQSDAMKSVSDYLLEHPHESVLTLTEQGSINVTAVDPNTNEKIDKNSYIGSNLFDENGDPRTITDHLNDLLNAVPQEAGKKYDADGWQLWEAVVSCGGINNFSQIELDEKPDSIGVTELNKVKKEKVLVYFPQVEIAPSLEITAPVVGETPSFECKIVDKVGGYSVISVEWSCGNTLLGENDKFEAGKKYTVTILLSADVNLSFVNSTPVTINGEKAGTSYDENIGFYAYQSFTTAPEKPVNVKATAGDGKVTLTWDAFPNATSYRIYRANSETGAKSLLKAVTTTTYTDTTVTAGNTYYYFVAAYNSKTATLSEYSDAAKVTVPAVLVAPVISTITTDGSSVTLAWNKVTGATSYRIYRADTATGAKTLLKGVAATTYTDSTVTAGKTYYYFVAAYDSVNKKLSEYSDAAKVTVPAVLVAPVISTITTDGSSVTLAWNKVTGATSYRIYRADTATGAKTLLKAVTSATYTDTTVTAGKTYYYFVAAYDSVNKKLSDYSAAKSITVQSAFAAPSISSITTDGSSVTLAWNKVTGATSYRIYRADSATGAKTLLKAVTSATYTDTTVTAGKTYYYFVAAYDSVNKKLSDYSAAKSIKVEAAIAAPVISTITTDGSSVTLAWNKVTGATSYRIYRADTATGTKTLLKAVTSATYTDTTVTAGKTYYYFVAAYDSVNKKLSDYSAAKSIKVEAAIAAPVISTITTDGSSVTLTWNKVTGATSYRIYRADSATGAKTLLKAVTSATYTDTTVTAGKTYYYFVAAYDSVNSKLSAYSSAKSITVS